MTASVSDLIRKVSSSASVRPSPAYLTGSGKTLGAASITVSTTTGWATDTGIDLVIYEKDTVDPTKPKAGTVTTWKATVSGTTLNGLTLEGGSDRPYSAGENTVVLMSPTAGWANDIATAILTHADQDGTLKAGAVDNSSVLADNVVTNAKLADNAVDTAEVKDGAITNAKISLTGGVSSDVAAVQSTTSSTYADLSTAGPSVTVTIGPSGYALINIQSSEYQSASGNFNLISFVASGANTIAVGTSPYIVQHKHGTDGETTLNGFWLLTGLTPGSTTFKMQYKVSAGAGTFFNRTLTVVPL